MPTFFEQVARLQADIDALDLLLTGGADETVTINGTEKKTISMAIADRFAGLQAMVQGRLSYATKALMDAAGAPPASELAEVWNDPASSNNGLYGWSGSAWTKSPYDPTNAPAIEHFLRDYEVELVGGSFEVDEDRRILRKTTASGDAFFLPVQLPDGPAASESYVDAAAAAVTEAIPFVPEDYQTGYELDLCGYFDVLIDDAGRIGQAVSSAGEFLFMGGAEQWLTDYEQDLCGQPYVLVDRNGRQITSAAAAEESAATVTEDTVVNSRGDAAWVQQNGATYALQAYEAATGITRTLGSAGSNRAPALDDGGRVIYVRDGVRYWQNIDGGDEWPFLSQSVTTGFGDSMTAPGSGYSDIFAANYPEYGHSAQGIGGQRSFSIAARTGAVPVTVTVSGNQIPATGSVAITAISNSLLNTQWTQHIQVEIAGVVGTLTCDNFVYTFTRDQDGSAVATSADEPITVLTGLGPGTPIEDLHTRINIFWLGRNDIAKSDYDEQAVLDYIEASVSSCKAYARRFLVLGVTNGWYDLPTAEGGSQTEANAQLRFEQILGLNAALASRWGAHYVDMIDALAAYDPSFTSTYNVLGTDYEVLNSNFSSDGIHGNTAGRTAVAAIIFNTLQAKGW